MKSPNPAALELKLYASPADLPPEVLACFSRHAVDGGCPEARSEWFANLQDAVFSEGSTVAYAVSASADQSCAVLPVRRAQEAAGRWLHSLSNYYTSLYDPPLCGPRAEQSLADCLASALGGLGPLDAARFAPMECDGRAQQSLIAGFRAAGWVPFRFYCFGNWYLNVAGSWSDFLASREGALRSTIKRKGRKFDAAGGRLELVVSPDDVERAIEAYTSVYAKSWKKPEPYPRFVPGLARWLADKGELRMGIAWLDQRPIAAQLWIVTGSKASIFKLAYDEDCAELAAGTLLTAFLMEHVIDRDCVTEIDYLIGDDSYKRSWMGARRERWGVVAYNPRTAIGLTLLARELLARVTKGPRRFAQACIGRLKRGASASPAADRRR